jgi:ribosomal protein S18 acetylase RimI-like enzyme/nitroimidazol reductase NimA-like FMN-containing flavoprotein (pyridoxamine 5'-phosphate oxidase superfamily)
MRRREHQMGDNEAWALLERAPFVRIATHAEDGEPVLRPLHAVIEPGQIAFHGAPAGEKMGVIGQRAVIGWEEIIAEIPSYWTDPERACPATTLFLSVQAHGTLIALDDLEDRARVLRGLMARYQPEGGYAPITTQDKRYLPSIRGLLILAMRPERVEGKAKLGQNRKPAEITAIARHLWERGAPGDARAISLILAANPDAAPPALLAAPAGAALLPYLDAPQREAAADLIAQTYWCAGQPREALIKAFESSAATVGATINGELVACARAVSDHSRRAWIYDVFVAPSLRKHGVGDAMLRLLLDHPALRGVRQVRLGTRDAAAFYQRHGFVNMSDIPRSYPVDEMMLSRVAEAAR